ncbi:TIGR02678 family protein [Streptomyces sp. 6N223]|uniref:TIGR02678 family protein n=1 Tax=Streptomyces sp. 6N223 TaxID=3457412 RepID=UPI003FCF13C3
MSNLANQLVVAEREEVARGIRLLLGRPLLTERADPEAFALVVRRRQPLGRWFDHTLGWTLAVEPRLGYACLLKVRSYAVGDRPARRPRAGRAPLDRRRYVLFCVTCAELLAVPVTTVGLLADRVVRAIATDEALPAFDTARRDERMAFVDVLKLLEGYGALRTLDGSTESFTESAGAKVLYQVESGVMMRLLATPVSPSRVVSDEADASDGSVERVGGSADLEERLGRLTRERRYGAAAEGGTDGPDLMVSATQHNLWLRHSVLRRLFDDPVLYREELTEAQLGYLASPTGRQILRRAADQAGFVLEERAEGWLLVDPDGLATDGRFPDDASHAKVAALLLLDRLTGEASDSDDGDPAEEPVGATTEQLTAEVAALLVRFPGWGRAYRSEDGAARLAADALSVLSGFGLVRHDGGRVTARPAAARYRVTHTTAADGRPHGQLVRKPARRRASG